nr:MAG TPA: hypothetical protein [Caudoviricetes sp.]
MKNPAPPPLQQTARAGGQALGGLTCRDVTIAEIGWAAQCQNLRNRQYTTEPDLRLRLPISYKLNTGGRFF